MSSPASLILKYTLSNVGHPANPGWETGVVVPLADGRSSSLCIMSRTAGKGRGHVATSGTATIVASATHAAPALAGGEMEEARSERVFRGQLCAEIKVAARGTYARVEIWDVMLSMYRTKRSSKRRNAYDLSRDTGPSVTASRSRREVL